MKFLFASVLALAAGFAAGTVPDCQVNDVDGYGNCKHEFYVNAPGSDVLWCDSEASCNKVFFPPTAAPTDQPTPSPVSQQFSSIEEGISSSTMATTGTALLATASAMVFLC